MPNLLLTTVNIRFSFYIFRKKGAARLTYYVLLQFNQKEKGTCWGISYNAKGRGHDPFNPTPLMLEMIHFNGDILKIVYHNLYCRFDI